ncbi:ATP-binding protein [Synechococcus sp. CCY 9618]|uniref:ATP-binding protein n=1 Tax=Synechococcus sp. CCY 9618 TaxID=2815602 RepID=UPI001C2237AF|nr:ATP-binding protein [Synechococcus sp. CCY 9618]
MKPLRCHLLIGPPASGKTTLAHALAPLLTAAGEAPARVLSTDRIRQEVFGDAAVQGPWTAIEDQLHGCIIKEVAAGRPVIVDATHARRPWRLAITQALSLPAPVEWIGWWLFTPVATCLEWNRRRPRLVPEPVIREMAAALADGHFGPSRDEGFAALVSVVPQHHEQLEPLLTDELARLDRRIRSATNREKALQLHGHSRLLDLERLLHLLRLLSRFPALEASDSGTRDQLEAIVSPLPQGDLADRAAAYLQRLHGACYGNTAAIRKDLAWLEREGFTATMPATTPLVPLPPSPLEGPCPATGGVHGGYPSLGDRAVFIRVLTLLRHLLQAPFDQDPQLSLPEHLIARLEAIPGSYLPGEVATLRKDMEKLLTPYGFRARNDNVRHGYAIGTALLSAPRLREVHALVQQAAGPLADPSAQDLLRELEERLHWGGIDTEGHPPVRAFANHAVAHPSWVRSDSLAVAAQAERIETAILEHRLVVLERYASAAAFSDSPQGTLQVWPLQLLFHNVAWYLVYEDHPIGRAEGLIHTERLERLALRQTGALPHRDGALHRRSLKRVRQLLRHCGGIYFGADLEQQLVLAHGPARRRAELLVTLRVSCQDWAFAFIREGQQLYPAEHTRFSRPLAGDTWWCHPSAPHVLEPNPRGDSHPYPVEFDLPTWTVARDVDLRRWLFGFAGGIRIESPEDLREEHQQRCREGLAAYARQASAPAFFPNRLRRS